MTGKIIHSRYPLSRRLSADQVKRAKKTRDQINEWLRKNGGCELVDFPDDAPDGEET